MTQHTGATTRPAPHVDLTGSAACEDDPCHEEPQKMRPARRELRWNASAKLQT